jgi:predicted RNase H-like HicB family nuclease
MTQGETLEEVLEMAKDLIGIYCVTLHDSGKMIPRSSRRIPKHTRNQRVLMINVDLDRYLSGRSIQA